MTSGYSEWTVHGWWAWKQIFMRKRRIVALKQGDVRTTKVPKMVTSLSCHGVHRNLGHLHPDTGGFTERLSPSRKLRIWKFLEQGIYWTSGNWKVANSIAKHWQVFADLGLYSLATFIYLADLLSAAFIVPFFLEGILVPACMQSLMHSQAICRCRLASLSQDLKRSIDKSWICYGGEKNTPSVRLARCCAVLASSTRFLSALTRNGGSVKRLESVEVVTHLPLLTRKFSNIFSRAAAEMLYCNNRFWQLRNSSLMYCGNFS